MFDVSMGQILLKYSSNACFFCVFFHFKMCDISVLLCTPSEGACLHIYPVL